MTTALLDPEAVLPSLDDIHNDSSPLSAASFSEAVPTISHRRAPVSNERLLEGAKLLVSPKDW
jgi:hypothetical protein